jgi:hypothetical protein
MTKALFFNASTNATNWVLTLFDVCNTSCMRTIMNISGPQDTCYALSRDRWIPLTMSYCCKYHVSKRSAQKLPIVM